MADDPSQYQAPWMAGLLTLAGMILTGNPWTQKFLESIWRRWRQVDKDQSRHPAFVSVEEAAIIKVRAELDEATRRTLANLKDQVDGLHTEVSRLERRSDILLNVVRTYQTNDWTLRGIVHELRDMVDTGRREAGLSVTIWKEMPPAPDLEKMLYPTNPGQAK